MNAISTQEKYKARNMIAAWLVACAAMVFGMAIVGAITRLTESGLSITEWQPLIGTFPPLNEAEWQHVFDLYRQTPEYIHKNAGMGIAQFKQIFFWEWFHRLWGRLIGVVFLLPYLYFLFKGLIPKGWRLKLFGLFVLGGLQGLMGWVMVQSGLIDQPSVSHYRLAAHLGVAALIFVLMVWCILQLKRENGQLRVLNAPRADRMLGWLSLGLAGMTLIWGAFVAGLDAGLIYNEFPLMGGTIMPSEMWHLSPAWLNLFENHAAVQFTHRALAVITAAVIFFFWWRVRTLSPAFNGLAIMILLQVGLGIATLLTQINITLATLHQAGAFLLLAKLVFVNIRIQPLKEPKTS